MERRSRNREPTRIAIAVNGEHAAMPHLVPRALVGNHGKSKALIGWKESIMADDRTRVGRPKSPRVNEDELRAAIDAVGNSADKGRAYLKPRR